MYIQARKYGLGRPILQLPGIMVDIMGLCYNTIISDAIYYIISVMKL